MRIDRIDINWTSEMPIFASTAYLKSQSDDFGWLGGYIDNDLVFVLPYVVHRKLLFRYMQFQTETILVNDSLANKPGTNKPGGLPELEREFLNGVVDFTRKEGIDFISQPPPNALFRQYPSESLFTPYGTHLIDLEVDEDALWSGLHSTHRNRIRKAKKEGVHIEKGLEYTGIAHGLMKQTMERSNMSFMSKEKFNALIESLGSNCEIHVAMQDEEPQGCSVLPFSNYAAYYLYGGSSEHPANGALNLLSWEAILYFKSIGAKQYNFAGARISPKPGSKHEGIQRFKSKFGAEMKTGYLWKMPINRNKYNLYNRLSHVKNSRHGDIIDQERCANAV